MKRSLFGLGLLLLTGCAANAQTTNAPPLMNFQGRLAKPDGTALTDGTHTVTFTLYTQATGGAALWTETDTVTVHNGAFAATLGKITALTDAVFAANDWLEIKVDNAAALSPRQQLVSVASAFKADTALTVPDGSITLTKLAPGVLNFNNIGGTVNTSQFAANTIPINALAGNPLGAISGFSVEPSLVSSISTGATPTSVAVSGNVACVTPQGANSLQVFDVTNPAAPVLSGTVTLGFQPFSVAISGHYAYVAGGINIPNLPTGSANLYSFLDIVDISNPAAPTLTGGVQLIATNSPSGTPDNTVAVAGNYAYVADITDNILFIVNISNAANPSTVGAIGTGVAPRYVAVSGSYAYVVNQNDSTFQAFNVSNPASPTRTATVNTQSTPVGLAIAGSTAYVLANGTTTLQAFSLSNPAAPVFVGSAGTTGSPNAVTTSGGNAYVVNGTGNSLQVFSLANPSAPVLTQTIAADNNAFGVAVSGSLAYVTGYYDNVLQIFNLNGSMTTTLQASNGLSASSIYSPSNSVYVHGNSFMDSLNLYGGLTVDYNSTNPGSINGAVIRFGAGSGEGIVSNRTGSANRYGLDLYTGNTPRVSVTNGGNVGIGTSAPLAAFMSATHNNWNPGYNNGWGDFVIGDGTRGLVFGVASTGGGAGASRIWTKGGSEFLALGGATSGDVLTINGVNVGINGPLTVNGIASTHKLVVTGGSDVAEPYNIAAGAVAPIAGYVVAIDRARIGQMRVADKEYDTTVSGIISGANGVEPGITLTQKGTVADGSLPVASVGRVWCWCDADAGGAIAAGDLLTTSATLGHAMKANDARRERGAILGKAMSPLAVCRGEAFAKCCRVSLQSKIWGERESSRAKQQSAPVQAVFALF